MKICVKVIKKLICFSCIALLLPLIVSCSSKENDEYEMYSNKIQRYVAQLNSSLVYCKINEIKGKKANEKHYFYFEYEASFEIGSEIFVRDGIGIFINETQYKIYRYVDKSLHEDSFTEFDKWTSDGIFDYIQKNIDV